VIDRCWPAVPSEHQNERRFAVQNQIVSHEEWLKARVDLRAAEKEFKANVMR
jgi:predicted dithiol-disulfide oxidoreductase (DUF899 family)